LIRDEAYCIRRLKSEPSGSYFSLVTDEFKISFAKIAGIGGQGGFFIPVTLGKKDMPSVWMTDIEFTIILARLIAV